MNPDTVDGQKLLILMSGQGKAEAEPINRVKRTPFAAWPIEEEDDALSVNAKKLSVKDVPASD